MDEKPGQIPPLFDNRFLDKHAGTIISDPGVALIELVANAWDAYATRVDITWPDGSGTNFSITDNGLGLTAQQFAERWRTLDYDRVAAAGEYVSPPPESSGKGPRRVYGRNGRGRHGAFAFSNPYKVVATAGGERATFLVSRGSTRMPFDWREVHREPASGHGLAVQATNSSRLKLASKDARELLGARFLTDPDFRVFVDGHEVTFDDIPTEFLRESYVDVPELGRARIIMIDAQKADRTTRQHGIAWHVNNRLVGECGWRGSDFERILDGRTNEAKRYTFIVVADFLGKVDAILPDWSGFSSSNEAWKQTYRLVQDRIRDEIEQLSADRRRDTKYAIKQSHSATIANASPLSRDRWAAFVDQVIDSCPSIGVDQIQQIAGILANLEVARSRFGLIEQLHRLLPGELDSLTGILADWSVTTARIALDEIQNRLKLIAELHDKLRDERADEVRELQPLMERSLWAFGAEFESIEFTSNRGMSEVVRKLFRSTERGSLNRPDFVVIPDGSVGLYARPRYGDSHDVDGVESLVVVELKKPGIAIGMDQKNQAWKYVVELQDSGLIDERTTVTCFVLGSRLMPREGRREEGATRIIPMAYETFIKRAEARMLNLYSRLKDAPFLLESGLDVAEFSTPEPVGQLRL